MEIAVICVYQNTAVQGTHFFFANKPTENLLKYVDLLKNLFIAIFSFTIARRSKIVSPCFLLVLDISSPSGLALMCPAELLKNHFASLQNSADGV